MDRFAALAAFVRVIEAKGFAPAARQLGMATSSVTRRVDALEAALNTALLSGSTQQVTPTEAGRAYYARTVRLLEDLAAADAEVAGTDAAPRGALKVSALVTFARHHLAPLLPEFL
jgi:DNA-binding transcriptional LysR family regulator